MVKIKDGDADMVKGERSAMRYNFLESARNMENALDHYITGLPQSAAHIYPCLKAIENAYVKAAIKNGDHDINLLLKYSTWAYDNHRLAFKHLKKNNYKECEKVINKAGGTYSGANGLYNVISMSCGYWMPQGKNKFRVLPTPAKQMQFAFDYHGLRRELRLHNKTLVMEGSAYKPTQDKRLSYCQMKRNHKLQYQFDWKDDKQKDMGLYFYRHKVKFGGNGYKTYNWLEMAHNKKNSFLWTLVPYGKNQFMPVHHTGKIMGCEYKSRCYLNDKIGKNNKAVYIYVSGGHGYY